MNNAHRLSLLSFVSELCRHHGTAPPPTEVTLATLDNIICNYFNTQHGSFWIFYNSDVTLVQDLDGSQYIHTSSGQFLEDDLVIQFFKDDYNRWCTRTQTPSFTEEESHYLLPVVGFPPEVVWPVLMWCGSPSAMPWRAAGNPVYAGALYYGSVVEYKGRIFGADEVEYVGCTGGECHICGETLPCVYMDNFEEVICAHCNTSNAQTACPDAATCPIFSCKHNPEHAWPVAAAGRRYHGRKSA